MHLWIQYIAFGYLGISTRLTVPPSFSQSATPFIAFWRQDIPHTPLVAWPHCSHPPDMLSPVRRLGVFDPPLSRLGVGSVTFALPQALVFCCSYRTESPQNQHQHRCRLLVDPGRGCNSL